MGDFTRIASSFAVAAACSIIIPYTTANAGDEFITITSSTNDGYVANLISTNLEDTAVMQGVLWSSEFGLQKNITVRILNPDEATKTFEVQADEPLSIDTQDGQVSINQIYGESIGDGQILLNQYTGRFQSNQTDETRRATIVIAQDPWPIGLAIAFGAITLVCTSSHFISVYADACEASEFELSLAPPSCSAKCS